MLWARTAIFWDASITRAKRNVGVRSSGEGLSLAFNQQDNNMISHESHLIYLINEIGYSGIPQQSQAAFHLMVSHSLLRFKINEDLFDD